MADLAGRMLAQIVIKKYAENKKIKKVLGGTKMNLNQIQKIQKKIDPLLELVQSIEEEISAIEGDFDSLDDAELTRLSKDLEKFEDHLRKSANCLTHLTGWNFPDWGKKIKK